MKAVKPKLIYCKRKYLISLILKIHDGKLEWITGRTGITMAGDLFLFTIAHIDLP